LELLEKLNKTNNELGQVKCASHSTFWIKHVDNVFPQWALMQDRAEQGGAANVKQQVEPYSCISRLFHVTNQDDTALNCIDV
jgi:hypothetical protein